MPPRAALAAALMALAVPPPGCAPRRLCDGRPIRAIRIDARRHCSRPTTAGLLGVRARRSAMRSTGGPTSRWWRRELLFREGEPCDPRAPAGDRAAAPRPAYIRSAVVIARRHRRTAAWTCWSRPATSWSLRGRHADQRWRRLPRQAPAPRRARTCSAAASVSAPSTPTWAGGRPSRRTCQDPHFLGRRIDAELEGGKSEVGPLFEETVRRSFESEFDRFAWRESVRYRKEPFPLVVHGAGRGAPAAGRDRRRCGRRDPRGRAGTGADRRVGAVGRAAPRGGRAAGADAATGIRRRRRSSAGRFSERRLVRAHLLLGARSVRSTRTAAWTRSTPSRMRPRGCRPVSCSARACSGATACSTTGSPPWSCPRAPT